MLVRSLLALLALAIAACAPAPATGPSPVGGWLKDPEVAKTQAKTSGKKGTLLYFTGSGW